MKMKGWLVGVMGVMCAVVMAVFAVMPVGAVDKTQNFTISSFTADYYLTKTEEGTSNLHVKETIVAEFPEADQNHGIERTIPRTNQGGKNYTVKNKSALNFSATRGGMPEEVDFVDESAENFVIQIGSSGQYVHGTQTYVLEYDFANVITEFDVAGQNVSGQEGAQITWQELYWNTNGTEWQQRIDKLTANLHLTPEEFAAVKGASDVQENGAGQSTANVKAEGNDAGANDAESDKVNGDVSCYVGGYGASGTAAMSRCEATETSDGYSFTTEDLASGENLTFAVEFEPGTFVVKIEPDYTLVIIAGAEVAIGVVIFVILLLLWNKYAAKNYRLYKSLFTAPQYQPPADLLVSEAQRMRMKQTKSTYVAALLEMAVRRKVTIKNKEKKEWSVILNVDPDTLTEPERDVLGILAYNIPLVKGLEIPVTRHNPNTSTRKYARDYEIKQYDVPNEKGYLVSRGAASQYILLFLIVLAIAAIVTMIVIFANSDLMTMAMNVSGPLVGGMPLCVLVIVLFAGIVIGGFWFGNRISTYARFTEKGVEMARYLDGLELYIKMAEQERIKFLQSVQGVDTSAVGIVNLYEKLLPWACLFGLEKSWARELEKYYQMVDETGRQYDFAYNQMVMNGIIAGNMTRQMNSAMTSVSGGSSSSSSGGGGGGFSGGGGGGGGGGGW